MPAVAMKINQANLVKGLKYSFTNRTTVLGELMQNARRAGASQANFDYDSDSQTLTISDDGNGIESIETLLTVAETGWDADLVAHEHPFGLGFMSALFACRHITVASKSGYISVETERILAFQPVTFNPVNQWDGVTQITLVGYGLDPEILKQALARLAKGFAITVTFNGEQVARPSALDSGLGFVNSAVGSIYLAGFGNPACPVSRFEVFLQGLPIYRSNNHYEGGHIIHLDSSQFYARLPDRDKLVDEEEVIVSVNAALKQAIENRLTELKAAVSSEEFVGYFEMMAHWRLLYLLNDVDLIPTGAIKRIIGYPVCDEGLYGSFMADVKTPITRAAIAYRQFEVVVIDEDIQSEGANRTMFAWLRDCLVYQDNLDKGHWLHPYIRNLNDEKVILELVNESHYAAFDGSWVGLGVTFCEAYRIKIGGDCVEVSDYAMYQGYEHGETLIMPKGDTSSNVIEQAATFRTEWDDYQQATHDDDCAAFIAFVVANTAADPTVAMQRLLPEFTGCPSLFGKSFIVSLDESGRVAMVLAA